MKNTLLKATAKDLIMKELLLYLAIEVYFEAQVGLGWGGTVS